MLTRLLHSGFISEKSEQNDGVAVLEESGGSVSMANIHIFFYRIGCRNNLNEKNDKVSFAATSLDDGSI